MQLWKHQQVAVEKSLSKDFLALFFDPGTGKTGTTIRILLKKFVQHAGQFPVLIFCPPVVIPNWAAEWKKFADITNVVQLTGSQKKRVELFKKAKPNSIFVTNYEALLMKDLMSLMMQYFSQKQISALVLDESHKVKDIKSKRTKYAINISDNFTYRYILTGTPLLRNYLDLFTQFRVLSKNIFGTNYFVFRSRFFRDKNAGMPSHKHFPDFVLLPGAENEIKRIVDEHTSFAKKSDCLDLPPLIRKKISIPLGPEQKRLYEAMKKDFVATVLDQHGKVRASVAELVITKALRLQQIVSGHLRVANEDGTTSALQIKDNPRKLALREILEDLAPHHKVIVWAVFKDNYVDIREVCDAIGVEYVEITGETTDKQRSVDRFNNDDSVRVCIGNPAAGGIGINLVSAGYSVYYSRTFSLEHDIQSEARNYRGGSEIHDKVTRIDLVAEGTIDELVLESLAEKQEMSETILRQALEKI